MEELAPYMRGWRGYFGFCETPEVLIALARWVRLRLRAALWRQWKTPRRRRAALIALRVSGELRNTAGAAAVALGTSPGAKPSLSRLQCSLQIARSPVLDRSALGNFSNRRVRTRTYVVGKGSSREDSPYPDRWPYASGSAAHRFGSDWSRADIAGSAACPAQSRLTHPGHWVAALSRSPPRRKVLGLEMSRVLRLHNATARVHHASRERRRVDARSTLGDCGGINGLKTNESASGQQRRTAGASDEIGADHSRGGGCDSGMCFSDRDHEGRPAVQRFIRLHRHSYIAYCGRSQRSGIAELAGDWTESSGRRRGRDSDRIKFDDRS